jgi:hypothetical protein
LIVLFEGLLVELLEQVMVVPSLDHLVVGTAHKKCVFIFSWVSSSKVSIFLTMFALPTYSSGFKGPLGASSPVGISSTLCPLILHIKVIVDRFRQKVVVQLPSSR